MNLKSAFIALAFASLIPVNLIAAGPQDVPQSKLETMSQESGYVPGAPPVANLTFGLILNSTTSNVLTAQEVQDATGAGADSIVALAADEASADTLYWWTDTDEGQFVDGLTFIRGGTSDVNGQVSMLFEGATDDAFELTLAIPDVTADATATFPGVAGQIALTPTVTTVALTADDQAVTIAAGTALAQPRTQIILLNSDDATSTNRTFTLAGSPTAGQVLILVGGATNASELADSGTTRLSATWTVGAGDTLTLVYADSNWNELARSNN